MNNSSATNSLNDDYYDDDVVTTLNAGIYINNYYLWVIFGFGFPGNLASIITILRMQRVTTSTFYVATLAAVDNFSIVLKLLYHQLTFHQAWLGPFGCKLMNYLVLIFPTCANWILVFIATERLVAVRHPLKIGMYWTIARAEISVIGLGILTGLFYLHVFWTFTGLGVQCIIPLQYLNFYKNIWYWLNATVYSVVPCVLLAIFNAIIIRSVRKSTVVRKALSMKREKKQSATSHSMRQDAQITIMLVSVAVVFIILTVPRCIFLVLHLYWEVKLGTMEDAQKYLLDQLTFVLCDSNHAINFYLYFITGKNFRRHFLDMVLCRRRRIPFTSVSQTGMSNTMQTKYLSHCEENGSLEHEI